MTGPATNETLRILIVTETIHGGGAETFVLRLARALNHSGVCAEILCLNPDLEDGALLQQYQDLVIHRIALPQLRWIKRADRLRRRLGLHDSLQYRLSANAIRRAGLLGYDVYHTHLMPVDLLFSKLKRHRPELRLISTLHGDYNSYEHQWESRGPHRVGDWPQKLAAVKAGIDKWVYISREQLRLFSDRFGIPESALCKIYNGYEPPAALPAPGPRSGPGLRFIMVARGIADKGWEQLVAAFMQLSGPHELILVGKGPALDALEPVCRRDARIRFAGFHPNPAALVSEADVFVFPSRYKAESLPTVIIEALYCGKAVISSRIGEVAEMLRTESGPETGQLLSWEDPERQVGELVAAMQRYVDDPALLATHQEQARQAFVKFDMKVCAEKYIQQYRELCRKS
jgi:glycosyltransferase involved in cell wall biosynthesis